MKRRPPSLRRVAVEGRCPGFIGTTQTLRLPAARPAALRCLRLAVPPLRRLFAPADGRRAALGPGCLVTRPSAAPRSVGGGGRISQVPAQALLPPRTCSFDPGETARACLDAPVRRGHGFRNGRGYLDTLSRLNRMAGRLAVYASKRRVAPTRCKTRFRLRGYALPGGLRTHWACCEKFPLCVQFTSLSPFAS